MLFRYNKNNSHFQNVFQITFQLKINENYYYIMRNTLLFIN